MTITARMGAAGRLTPGPRGLEGTTDLDLARRLFAGMQRARSPKARLRMRRAYEAHLADVGARGVRWEPDENGKYVMTELVR